MNNFIYYAPTKVISGRTSIKKSAKLYADTDIKKL